MGISALQYREQMQALLPIGSAWPRDDDADITKTLDALAEEYARVHARADRFLLEIIPATTTEMIDDYELMLALPDPCMGVLEDTLEKRRGAVIAKLTGGGSGTPAHYTALALTLGYVVVITEPGGNVWQMDIPANNVSYFNVGSSVVGDRLISYGSDFIECFFLAIKPSHTQLNFNYV